jgi:hypothetical protein
MHIIIRRGRMVMRGQAAHRNPVYSTITDAGSFDPLIAIGPRPGKPITEWF